MSSVVFFSHLLLVAQGEANSDNANDNDDDDDGDEFFDASEDGNISHTG